MKAKKWLTIITLIITALSLVLAFIIGKNSNCITSVANNWRSDWYNNS